MKTILEYIGNTPLVKIEENNGSKIFAKMEGFNPGGFDQGQDCLEYDQRSREGGNIKEGRHHYRTDQREYRCRISHGGLHEGIQDKWSCPKVPARKRSR